MTADRAEIGQRGEDAACRYLASRGLVLLERNYRCRYGEVDLVMADRDCLVFVEVRVRSHPGYGDGAESVDGAKQRRLARAAEHYLTSHPDSSARAWRFDVVALRPHGDRARVKWIPDAFEA